MKNALSYYYNLNPIEIHQINNRYKFKIDNDYYTLLEIKMDNNINEIYELSKYLNSIGIYTHQIILNLQNNITTYVNNNNYVLLKTYDEMNKKIQLEDIINFSNITSNISKNINLRRDNWYNLWINKLDYFEYQISQIGIKYPLIRESFSYFAGMTETAISFLINEKINNNIFSICHNRVKRNNTLFDLYNPFNFIIDTRIRDVTEYFKEMFYIEDPYDYIIEYIKYNNLSNDELKLLYIRMLYPSYYFDLYEDIINKNKDEKELEKIIKKVNEYELLLKKIYIYINNIVKLPDIEWIKKM